MKKYTLIVSFALTFGALNVSAQNTEKSGAEKKEGLEKNEVKIENKAVLKPAKPVKTLSTKKRNVQKAIVEEKKEAVIKKEENL